MNRAPTLDFSAIATDWLLANAPPFLIDELTALVIDAKVDVPGIGALTDGERQEAVKAALRLHRKAIEKRYRLGRGSPAIVHAMDDDEMKTELDRFAKAGA